MWLNMVGRTNTEHYGNQTPVATSTTQSLANLKLAQCHEIQSVK